MSDKMTSRKGAVKLWTVQGLLAAMFLFAGGMKWAMPIAMLEAQSHLPGAFVRFIGVCEPHGVYLSYSSERKATMGSSRAALRAG